MAELSTIARPYAAAAFAAAKDSQVGLETWAKAVKQLSEVVSVPEVLTILSDPKTTDADSIAVFDTVLPSMPADVKNFVQFGLKDLIVENLYNAPFIEKIKDVAKWDVFPSFVQEIIDDNLNFNLR